MSENAYRQTNVGPRVKGQGLFSGHEIQIDNQVLVKIDNVEHSYSLAVIVYYGSDHFTAQIILQDG